VPLNFLVWVMSSQTLIRIGELFLAGLTAPGLNARNGRPRVKRSVDFDSVKFFQVMAEPVILRHTILE
jgi:hypothetical protein